MQRAPEREFQKRNVYISRFGCFFLILDFVQWKEITNHGRSSGPWGVRGALSWEDGPWSYKSHMFSLVVRSPSGAVVLYWKDAHMGLDFLRHNWGHVFLPSFWSIWNLFIQRVFCWAAWKKKNRQQRPERWADLYWKLFWLPTTLWHFSLFYVHCKEAKSEKLFPPRNLCTTSISRKGVR